MDFNAIAKGFTDFYYKTFDTDRAQLRALYGVGVQGVDKIIDKLESLAFKKVAHHVTSVDAHPSHPQLGSILVVVTGLLLTDEEAKPLPYCQTFNLVPEGTSFWVLSDIFRLNYG